MITTGIDLHKASVTAAAFDPTSKALGHRRLAATTKTAEGLISWALARAHARANSRSFRVSKLLA